jgi:serine/threonine-protein kinase
VGKPPDSLSPKTRIDRYELLCHVAEGGMGTVWVARQLGKHGFERLVAFKTVKPTALSDMSSGFDFRRMFLDEARIASRIEHPNVAQVLDVGEEGGLLFMVMELIDGESVAALVQAVQAANKPFPYAIAMRIAADVCAGLHAAHELRDKNGALLNVVHRDVSPQNVLVTRNGAAKVIDFGVAKARGRLSQATDYGSLKGKLRYMAPEQARSDEIDRRADVYSVGAMLYRLVAGRAPIEGPNEAATLNSLLSGERPVALPDKVPQKMRALIERALSYAPAERFGTANDMRLAIEDAISTHRLSASASEIAAFLESHLANRLDARREAIELALELADAAPQEQPALGVRPSSSPEYAATALGPPPVPARPAPKKPPPPAPAAPPPVPVAAAPAAPSKAAQIPHPAAPLDDASGPGFMNVQELLNKKGQGAPELEVPKQKPSQTPPPAKGPEPKIELAAPVRRPRPPPPKGPPRWRTPAIAASILFGVLAVAYLLLPAYVKSRAVAAAREMGFSLEVSRVGVTLSSVDLEGVTITSPELPSMQIKCKDVHVSSTFSPRLIQLREVDVTVTGSVADVEREVEAWRSRRAGGGRGAASGAKMSVSGSHVLWKRPFGDGYELEISDVSAEISPNGALGDEMKLDSRRIDFKTPRGRLGPWGLSVERDAKSTRMRLELDPIVPDGPVALLVSSAGIPTRLTVKVARAPLARLGIPPEAVGLTAPPEIELNGDGTLQAGRVDTSFTLALYGIKPGPSPALDLRLKTSIAGDTSKPLELKNAELMVGPFTAKATGTLTPNADGGWRADVTWRADPVSCEVLAKRTAQGATALGLQVAQAFGIARLVGTANASGFISFDTRSPEKAAFTMTGNDTCGLAIFPEK